MKYFLLKAARFQLIACIINYILQQQKLVVLDIYVKSQVIWLFQFYYLGSLK